MQDLVFDPIRLFINATETKHYALLYHLVDAVKEIQISIGDDEAAIQKNARFEIPALQDVQEMDSLLKVRDEDDEEFLNGQFGGHRLLLEYFSFVQRFFYVDLVGLDTSSWPEDMTEFTIHVSFKDAFNTAYQLTDKDLLFNTVPIINLFSGKSHVQPLTLDGKHAEYEVRPFPEYKDITEIYAVNGLKSTTGTSYVASTAFEILSSPAAYPEPQGHRRDSGSADQPVFYSTSTKRVADQLSKTYVQLIQDDEELEHVVLDRVNVQTLVTNGNFPSIRLGEGTITGTRSTEWAGLRVSNIIRPTKVKECALRKDYLWAFIAHLTTNLRTIAEGNTLRQLLSLYNWNPNSEDSSHRKIRDGLVRMHPPEYKTRYQNGGFMRVLEVAIDVDLGQFEFGEGDLYLFGAVLSRFLSEYASLNTHVSLKLRRCFRQTRTQKRIYMGANDWKYRTDLTTDLREKRPRVQHVLCDVPGRGLIAWSRPRPQGTRSVWPALPLVCAV